MFTLLRFLRLATKPAYNYERAALKHPEARRVLGALAYAPIWTRARVLFILWRNSPAEYRTRLARAAQ